MLAFGAALAWGSQAPAANIKVILMGGQSNMVGTAPAPTNLRTPQAAVLYYHTSLLLTTLRPVGNNEFGPELSFGQTISQGQPGRNFGIIKYAVDGTSLGTHWDPKTGTTYSTFRDTVTAGITAMQNAGHNVEIVGMLWTQGEADAKSRTTAQYQADLIEFIADVRTRYGTNLPFFISRLSSRQTAINATGLAAVRAAQENVANADPNAYLIDTDTLTLFGDNLHFNVNGLVSLGQAFGNSFVTHVPVTHAEIFEQKMILAGLGAGQRAPLNTPFGDGIPNLLKYAFNLNFTGPDVRVMSAGGTVGLPRITLEGSGAARILRYEFVSRSDSLELTYTPKKSTSLAPGMWLPLEDAPSITPLGGDWARLI